MAKKKNTLKPVGTYAESISGITGKSNKIGSYKQRMENMAQRFAALKKEQEKQRALNAATYQSLQGVGLGLDMYMRKPMNAAINQSLQGAALGADMMVMKAVTPAVNQSLQGAMTGLRRLNRANNVQSGNVAHSGWLGSMPKGTQQTLQGKTSHEIIKDMDELRKSGYWDNTDDVNMWTSGKRTAQRAAWNAEAEGYRQQIEALNQQIQNSQGSGNRWDALLDLYTSPEVENERAIINGEGYTEEQKNKARDMLAMLLNRNAGAGTQTATERAQNFLRYNRDNMTTRRDMMNMDSMRRMAYDAMNGDGAYEQVTAGMDQKQKQALDERINEALDYVTDPNGKLGVQKRTAEMQLSNTEDALRRLDAAERREAEYDSFMAGRDYADTEYHQENNIYNKFTNIVDENDVVQVRPVDEIYSVLGGNNMGANWDITTSNYYKAALMDDEPGPDGYSEQDIFISYYNAGLYDEAMAFYRGLEPTLNQRYSYFEKIKLEDQALRLPVLSSVATVAATPLQTIEFAVNLPQQLKALFTGQDNAATDPFSNNYSITRYKNITRNKIAQALGGWGWAYQGFMSGADSALNAAIGKGIGLTGDALQYGVLGLFGTQAFETSLQNNMESGSNNFAYDWMEAFIDAAIETATEIWSVDNWLAEPTNLLKYVAKIGISEPSEEIVGAIVEPYIKELLGHKNQWNERAQQILGAGGYYDNGGNWVEVDNADAAQRQAMREWNHEIRMSAQSALMSVGPGMAYGGARLAYSDIVTGQDVMNNAGMQQVLDAAQGMDQKSAAYLLGQKIKQRAEAGKKNSAYKVGQLTQDIVRESREQGLKKEKEITAGFVREQLQQMNVQDEGMADIIVKALEGKGVESLTKEERQKLNANHDALNLYEQLRYTSQTSYELRGKQLEATQKESKAISSIADVLTKQKTMPKGDGIHLASMEDIQNATGEQVKGARGLIVDGVHGRFDGVRFVKDKDGNYKARILATVNGKQQEVGASSVLPTDYQEARIIQDAVSNPQFYSEKYTNKLMDAQEKGEIKDIDKALQEAKQVRLYAYAGFAMPITGLTYQLANEIYIDSANEHAENRKNDLTGENRAKVGKATYKGAEYGTEGWNKIIKDLDQNLRNKMDAIAAVAQRAGIEVDFTELDDDTIYGWQQGKKVGINIEGMNYGLIDGEKTQARHDIMVTFGHEMTHWLQANSLRGYNRLERYVMQQYAKNAGADTLMKRLNHHMQDNGYSLEESMSEIVADSCDQILNNEDVQQEIAKTDKGLYGEIKGFVKNLVEKIKKATINMNQSASRDAMAVVKGANELSKLWLGAYDEALSGELQEDEKQAPLQQVKMSRADTGEGGFEEDKYYNRIIINKENHEGNGFIKVGRVVEGGALNQIGIPVNDVRYDKSKIRYNLQKHESWLTPELLAEIPDILRNPVAITKYNAPNTVTVFGNKIINGQPMMVGLVVTKDRRGLLVQPKVRTANIRSDYARLINDDNILYITTNKKEARNWFQVLGINAPIGGNQYGLIKRIQLTDENVNNKRLSKADTSRSLAELDDLYEQAYNQYDDEEGEKLVAEAAEKAMPDSKVRDENGKLKKVYHQTNAVDDNGDPFTVFNMDRARHSMDIVGAFFAPEYDQYHEYGDRTYVAYLDIKNPAYDVRIDLSIDEGGLIKRNELIAQGYDGVINTEDGEPYEYVAFYPEQIKSAEAFTEDDDGELIPLSLRFNSYNPDIRWSKADTETIQALRNTAPEHIRTNMEARNRIYSHYGIKENDILFGIEFNEDGTVNYNLQDKQEAELIKKISKADLKTLKNLQEDTEKWRRVWKEDAEIDTEDYYKNAAEVDRAKEYAKQNPEAGLFGRDFVRPKEIFAAPVKMYGDFAAVNYRPLDMDNEYETAVRNGDMKKAERMLLEKYNVLTMTGTELTGYRAPFIYNGEHKNIAKLIKSGDAQVVQQVAEQMAPQVPDNAVLIPMPPHTGNVTDDTDTMILAKAIGEITGRPVVNALASDEHISRNVAKKEGIRGVTADAMKMRQIEVLPKGTFPVFIDNVVGGGATAEAARKAIGYGITLSYAQSSRSKSKGVKLIAVTYDSDGNLIPLSERMNPDNPSWKYSKADESSIDAGIWLANQTAGSFVTKDEEALMNEYRGLRLSMNLCLKRQLDYRGRINTLEAKDSLNQEEMAELNGLHDKLETQQARMTELENKMHQVTSSEGYAGLMYRMSSVLKDFVQGKTSEQVKDTVKEMQAEVQKAAKQIEQQTAELKELEKKQAVKALRSMLNKTSLSQQADMLQKQYNSAMSKQRIQDSLAEMALKMALGQDIQAEAEALAGELTGTIRGEMTDNLRYIRGLTLTIGKEMQAELKAENTSIDELRKSIKGSGVKIVSADKSHFVGQWNEIRENNKSLKDISDIPNERNALEAIIKEIKDELEASEGKQQYKDVDMDEATAICYGAAASVTMNVIKDPAAKAQIKDLMKQIKELSQQTGSIAEGMEQLSAKMQEVMSAGYKAADWAGILQNDVTSAIDYYNKVARVAAQEERNRVKQDVIKTLQSENTRKLLEQQDKYEQLLRDNREARETADDNLKLRGKINTTISRLKNRLTAETDIKNVQEEAKPLARYLCSKLVDHDMTDGLRKILFADKKQLQDFSERLKRMEKQFGRFNPDTDLDWLTIKWYDGSTDTELKEKVLNDIRRIDNALLMYWTAEGNGLNSLKDRKAALTEISEAVGEIASAINARNSAFIQGKRYEVSELAENMESEMSKSRFKGERTGFGSKARTSVVNAIGYGNLTPEYFFKMLRNSTMNLLHKAFNTAEHRSGLLAAAAQAKIKQIAQETGYGTWDTKKKHQVKVNGGTVDMTTEQIMALRATWMREKNNMRPEATAHLLRGGFVLAPEEQTTGKPGRVKQNQRPIRMTKELLENLDSYLTPEQIRYADSIVGYMSGEIADIGNQTSMETYGIKKFTEEWYFPIKSWGGVLNQASNQGVNKQNDNRAMRQSFTKRITAGAQNAVEISDFTPTAMKHIVGMINFNTVGPAVENLKKVLNYQLEYDTDKKVYGEDGELLEDNSYKRSVRAAFQSAYGKSAADYLAQFMDDINGGTSQGQGNTAYDKLLSAFKKNAVAGSLSVAAQQPLSYIRAAMMINPKYLAAAINPVYWKGSYAEMTKYSGLAVLKDMGKFDMNYGRSMIEFITPEAKQGKAKAAYEWISDKSTALPGAMDKMTWTRMWTACKLEQAAMHKDMDTNSEEFLNLVADRFEDLMRRTQVYDSVMVKSQNMRSNHWYMKTITSFMAEPTLSLNVLADAWMNIKEKGGKKNAGKALATFVLSAAAQAAAKAFFSMGRSPDKKKNKEENYLYRLAYNLIGEVNPLGLIPGYSQLIDTLQNGELTDNSMSVIAKGKDAFNNLASLFDGSTEKNWYRKTEDSIGQLVQLASDVPLKNFMRDFRAMVNFFSGGKAQALTGGSYAQRETSGAVLKYQAKDLLATEDLMGLINAELIKAGYGYDTSTKAYEQRIYQANKAGQTGLAQEMSEYLLLGKGKKEDDLNSDLRTLTKTDSGLSYTERIESLRNQGMKNSDIGKWIGDQYKKGEITKEEAVKLYMEANPSVEENDAYFHFEQMEYEKQTGVDLSETDYFRMQEALRHDSKEEYNNAVKELLDHGYTDEKVQSATKSFITKQYKDGKTTEKEAEAQLKKWCPELQESDIFWTLDRINYQKETGKEAGSGEYYRLYDAIEENKSEKITAAVKLMKDHGKKAEDIQKTITNKYKKLYLEAKGNDKVTLKDALTKAFKATGMTGQKAIDKINGWTKEKKKTTK